MASCMWMRYKQPFLWDQGRCATNVGCFYSRFSHRNELHAWNVGKILCGNFQRRGTPTHWLSHAWKHLGLYSKREMPLGNVKKKSFQEMSSAFRRGLRLSDWVSTPPQCTCLACATQTCWILNSVLFSLPGRQLTKTSQIAQSSARNTLAISVRHWSFKDRKMHGQDAN